MHRGVREFFLLAKPWGCRPIQVFSMKSACILKSVLQSLRSCLVMTANICIHYVIKFINVLEEGLEKTVERAD